MAGRGRRGVSPIVATLLLIVIAVAGAVVTYAFVSGFVSMPTEAPSASISVDCVTGNDTHVIIYVRNTGASQAKVDYVYIEQGGTLVASEDVDVDIPPGSVAAVEIGKGGLGTATYTFKVACAGSALPAVFSGRIAGSTTTPTDTTPPACSLIGANTTEAGAQCLFSSTWGDDAGLSGYIFSTNLTGAWVNSSWAAFSGSVGSEVMTLPPVGTVVGYTFYANDTSDNWGDSGVQYLTTGEYVWVPQNTTVVTGYTSPAAAPSGTWANPSYAYADGANYATTSTALAAQQWGAYGLSLPSNTTAISNIIIRYDAWRGAEPAYTEAFASFTPAGTGWQDYDIFTAQSVPKGAIAEITCVNSQGSADKYMGVRTSGSALDRYVWLHEAEGGGGMAVTMLVEVGEATGMIETYCDATAGATFYLMGYWTGVSFTEAIAEWTMGSVGWQDYDLCTNQGVPKGSVAQVFCANSETGTENIVGIRADGSLLNRYVDVAESEPTSETEDGYTTYVKCDPSTGLVECYVEDTTYCTFYCLGYFGASMDYVELWSRKDLTSYNSWVEFDLTSELDQDSRVATFYIGHNATGSERNQGVRGGDSALDRLLLIHEAEGGGYDGYCTSALTDANGIVDLYIASSSSIDYHWLSGYFKPVAVTVRIDASYDGGSSWVAFQETALTTSETTYTYDAGGLRTWSYSELDDADFRVRATAIISGLASVRLDWIPVNVTYTYDSSHWEYVPG